MKPNVTIQSEVQSVASRALIEQAKRRILQARVPGSENVSDQAMTTVAYAYVLGVADMQEGSAPPKVHQAAQLILHGRRGS